MTHGAQNKGSPEPGGAPFPYADRLVHNSIVFSLSDAFVITFALIVGDLFLQWINKIPISAEKSLLLVPAWWVGAYLMKIVPGWGLGPVEEVRRIELLLVGVFGIASVVVFLSRIGATASRITFLTAYALSAVLLPLARTFCKSAMIRRGTWGVPMVIYGNDETVEYVIDAMTEERGLGYNPIGLFDDDTPVGQSIKGIPVLGRTEENTRRAPYAILAAPSMSRERLIHLLEGPLSSYRRVIIIPDLLEAPSLWVKPRDFIGILGLEIASNLLDPVSGLIKYTGEWLLVALLAPVWVPLGALIALLVWLEDRRPPFFVQERVGKGGRLFKIIKFRTMCPGAEEVLQRELEKNEVLRAEWEAKYKLRNDPRVTRVGRLLRITSLDELPQLYNVLRGSMSLVGPRPLPKYHHDELPERVRNLRLRVRPGITGLWQVAGRSEVGNEGMERWDTYYVRNWSVWLDLVILVRTIRAVLKGHGAY